MSHLCEALISRCRGNTRGTPLFISSTYPVTACLQPCYLYTLKRFPSEDDRLFVYSDGVIECENPAGEAFSEQRLRRLLEETAELPVRVATEQVGLTLRDWKGDHPHLDDITLLVLERLPWPR